VHKKGETKVKKRIYVITLALLCVSMPFVLMHRASAQETVEATVDIYPKVLNLGFAGTWTVAAYIEIPGYNLSDIDVTSIKLNKTVGVDLGVAPVFDDYDGDTVDDMRVQFNRTKVSDWIKGEHIFNGTVMLNLTGAFMNGTEFAGMDSIKVKMPGDVNMDLIVNFLDTIPLGLAFGTKEGDALYKPASDENEDGFINFKDALLMGQYFGKTYS
jgi:hypothetical protein